MKFYNEIQAIIISEFRETVKEIEVIRSRSSFGSSKIRCILNDNSFIDIFFSDSGKYSFHWERRFINGLIFREDNAPDHPEIQSFPKHFHEESDDNIVSSSIPDNHIEATRRFFNFVKSKLSEIESK